MTVATLRNRVMETLTYDGSLAIGELSEKLQIPIPILRTTLFLLFCDGLIEGYHDLSDRTTRIQIVRHG